MKEDEIIKKWMKEGDRIQPRDNFAVQIMDRIMQDQKSRVDQPVVSPWIWRMVILFLALLFGWSFFSGGQQEVEPGPQGNSTGIFADFMGVFDAFQWQDQIVPPQDLVNPIYGYSLLAFALSLCILGVVIQRNSWTELPG